MVPGIIPFSQRWQTLFENVKITGHLIRKGKRHLSRTVFHSCGDSWPSQQPEDSVRVSGAGVGRGRR